jgi:transcriptional regulator with XRE-family HTH domain
MATNEGMGIALEEAIRSIPEASQPTFARSAWLARASRLIRDARKSANLTQEQLAARVASTQSSVARLEADMAGGYSLRRYIDVLIACDVLPHPLQLESVTVAFARSAGVPVLGNSPGRFQTEMPVTTIAEDRTLANRPQGGAVADSAADVWTSTRYESDLIDRLRKSVVEAKARRAVQSVQTSQGKRAA